MRLSGMRRPPHEVRRDKSIRARAYRLDVRLVTANADEGAAFKLAGRPSSSNGDLGRAFTRSRTSRRRGAPLEESSKTGATSRPRRAPTESSAGGVERRRAWRRAILGRPVAIYLFSRTRLARASGPPQPRTRQRQLNGRFQDTLT
jgi:hypothetical protein